MNEAYVIQALEHMAEHGGDWYAGTMRGGWYLYLSSARPGYDDLLKITQYGAREFLKHYEDLISENEKLKHCIKLLNEHYDEVMRER